MKTETRIIILFFYSCAWLSHAQKVKTFEPFYVPYAIDDGLRSNFIVNLYNDSRGLLWIGTANGLNTYNGKRFNAIDMGSAGETFVLRVTQSPEGTIWIITLDGGLYRIENGVAVPHPQNNRILSIIGSYYPPYQLAVENDSLIYIFGYLGTFEITNEEVSLVSRYISASQDDFQIPPSRNLVLINRFEEERTINVTCRGRSFSFPDTLPHIFSGHPYSGVAEKNFALSTGTHLLMFTDIVSYFKFASPVSNSLFFENDTVLWIGTEGSGAYRIVNGEVTDRVFPTKRIYAVLKDFEGGYWFGTDEEGLLYVPNISVKNATEGFKNGIEAHCIDAYDNKLAGITKDFRIFRHQNSFSDPILDPGKKMKPFYDIYESDSCNCFSHTNNDHTKGLTCINWRTGKIRTSRTQVKASHLILLDDDTLYISYTQIRYKTGNRDYIITEAIKRTRQVLPKEKEKYWVVSSYGIFVLTVRPEADSAFISRSYAGTDGSQYIFELSGTFIIAADNGYFYELDTAGGDLKRLNIPGRHEVQCYKQVDETQVLLGTAEGLIALVVNASGPQAVECRNLSHMLGLPKRLIKDIELIGDSIYCLTESEIFITPLPLQYTAPSRGRISIGKMYINGTEKPLAYPSGIYNDSRVEFGITAAGFKDGSSYTYAFRLLPLKTEWSEVTSEELAFYNLPSGDYTLQIKDPYQKYLEFPFRVDRYFYQQSWFLVLGILMLASLLASPFYFRNRLIVSRARLEKEKNNLRLRALTSQLKPHFVFNALSSIQSYILRKNVRESSDYLAKFAMHIRHALEQSNQDEISLTKVLESTRNYLDLERMRLEKAFDYSISVDPRINADELKIPVMLIQPYVENAVIHGMVSLEREGLIEIDFYITSSDRLLCTIRDNGKGLTGIPAPAGNGIGTRINKERMQLLSTLHKNRYEVNIRSNTPEAGVTVTIQILFSHEKNPDLTGG